MQRGGARRSRRSRSRRWLPGLCLWFVSQTSYGGKAENLSHPRPRGTFRGRPWPLWCASVGLPSHRSRLAVLRVPWGQQEVCCPPSAPGTGAPNTRELPAASPHNASEKVFNTFYQTYFEHQVSCGFHRLCTCLSVLPLSLSASCKAPTAAAWSVCGLWMDTGAHLPIACHHAHHGQCGSAGRAHPVHESRRCHSWSGHAPGLQVPSPVGARAEGN